MHVIVSGHTSGSTVVTFPRAGFVALIRAATMEMNPNEHDGLERTKTYTQRQAQFLDFLRARS
jgi:hypothetical protein